MRIVALHSKDNEVSISADGNPSTFEALHPMDLLAAAIAKDILDEIQKKSSQLGFDANDFLVRIILRKNTEKAQSKIIETHLELPKNTSAEMKNKLQQLANKSHLKRLLGNEILFEPAQIKE